MHAGAGQRYGCWYGQRYACWIRAPAAILLLIPMKLAFPGQGDALKVESIVIKERKETDEIYLAASCGGWWPRSRVFPRMTSRMEWHTWRGEGLWTHVMHQEGSNVAQHLWEMQGEDKAYIGVIASKGSLTKARKLPTTKPTNPN
eukprot:1148480-Pelagomonas_calceolata.AAC.1